MANPRELLNCAAENKKRRPAKPRREIKTDVHAAPVPQDEMPVRINPLYRPHSGHSAYSALMRSHDRVRPRIGR